VAERSAAQEARYRSSTRVTVVGIAVNLALAAVKITVGWLARSEALIADGIHSLSDLASDGLVLVAARHGTRAADAEHPYGHARIETAFTVGLGLLLLLVAVGITYDAVRRLFAPDLLWSPGPAALVVAVVSIVSKEVLYRYTIHVAKRLRSNLLRANAWHHRSDAVSSIVVLVGVAGAMAGLPYLDAIGAVGVGLMIAHIGWDLSWRSLRELVDEGLDPERVRTLSATIRNVDGVRALHLLRTRRMGADALVDVHIQVEPRLSVSEGHQVSEAVRSLLIHEFDEVSDVLVHIDPEDDERYPPCRHLPLRGPLLERLRGAWAGLEGADEIEDVTLHYLNGKVAVEIVLPLRVARDLEHATSLAEAYRLATRELDDIRSVETHFH